MARIIGKASDRPSQPMIAGKPKHHPAALAGGPGHRTHTGLRGQLGFAWEALADIPEFGQDLGGTDPAGARKGHDDLAVRQSCDGLLDLPRSASICAVSAAIAATRLASTPVTASTA